MPRIMVGMDQKDSYGGDEVTKTLSVGGDLKYY